MEKEEQILIGVSICCLPNCPVASAAASSVANGLTDYTRSQQNLFLCVPLLFFKVLLRTQEKKITTL